MNPAYRPGGPESAGVTELAALFDSSPRLRLRPMYLGQARRLLAGEDALASDIAGWAPGYPGEETRQSAGMLIRQAEAGQLVRGFGIYLIVRRSDDIIIGGIGFHGKPEHGRVEVGYDVASSAQAQGYATEALRALAGWALRQSEVEVVVGRTEAGNIASRRVMENAGFIPSGGPDAEGLHSFELRGSQKEDSGANH